MQNCRFQIFLGLLSQLFAPDSEGVFTFDMRTAPDCIHPPESVSPPSCSQLPPLQPEGRLMLLPYQRWRCLQLRGEEKKTETRRRGGGGGFFDWLAADGTAGVFIPRHWLISGACKSTWQLFTGAVNPADSIHFANCWAAASLHGEDQTLAPLVCVCPRDGKPNPLAPTRRWKV